jgi:hypothetical protein
MAGPSGATATFVGSRFHPVTIPYFRPMDSTSTLAGMQSLGIALIG